MTAARIEYVSLEVYHVARTVEWYRARFGCDVAYQDMTRALLRFDNIELRLAVPSERRADIGLTHPKATEFGMVVRHVDGTRSATVRDPSGNVLEIYQAG